MLSPRSIKADGSFGYQTTPYGPADCGKNQEKYISKIASSTGLAQYPLIDDHAGIDSVRLMMNTTAKRTAFIAAALSTMKQHKFQGYNLDIELGGSAADGLLYTKFVTEFAQALHSVGGVLSSDIGGQCGGADYIGMTCTDYKSTPIDAVMTMSTCELRLVHVRYCCSCCCAARLLAHSANRVRTHVD